MSIKRTIITTLVALALVAVAVPVVNAQTPTVASLMAMINQLTAELAQLQGGSTNNHNNNRWFWLLRRNYIYKNFERRFNRF